MKKIIISTIILVALSMGNIQAQKNYASFNYVIGFGTGDLGGYIDQTSFRGLLFEYRNAVNENIYVGIDAGWNLFYEKKDYDTYTEGTISVSGTQFRYSRHNPLLVSADYMFRDGESLRPYVGLGLGTMYTRRTTDMGVYRFQQDTWQFTLKPEVGLLYEINNKNGLKFGAKYYHGFDSGSLGDQSYISLSFGYVALF